MSAEGMDTGISWRALAERRLEDNAGLIKQINAAEACIADHAAAIAELEARNEALEATLGMAHAELTDHGHQELPECECRIAYVLRTALAADQDRSTSSGEGK